MSAQTPETTPTEDLPRFMLGIDFTAEYFRGVGQATSVLSQAAQNLDFAEVDGNPAMIAAAESRLREALETSEAPIEIVSKYQELYGFQPEPTLETEEGDR